MTNGRPLIDVLFPDEAPMSRPDPPDIAARLRHLIADRCLTASEVAKAAGMHRQQLDAILLGKNLNPGILTVARIVEAAGSSMAELFDTTGR
jgi:transcriptional regulator with XRE-family HTH domain